MYINKLSTLLFMQFIFSPHIKRRMLERGINEETVKDIIKKPHFVKKSFDGRKIAVKKIDKRWNVVYKEEGEKIVVISVFFE